MPYYNMKCRLCGGNVGQQFFPEENIPDNDPRMIGPALCGHHEFSDPLPEPEPLFTPNHGRVGTAVTLHGRITNIQAFFNGIAALNPRVEGRNLIVDVPNEATTGDLEIKLSIADQVFSMSLGIFTVEE